MENQENELSMNTLETQNLKITVSGKVASGKSLLLKVIKDCLERDYFFRTRFAGCNIMLDEKIEEIPDRSEEIDDQI